MHSEQPGGGIVCFGECMIELSRAPQAGLWRMGFAGDTANVAIYSARLGAPVSFMSAIGSDLQSDAMRSFLMSEGIDCRTLLEHPECIPGLYAIDTDAVGERSFTYWREKSAARNFFDTAGVGDVLALAASADLLYLSGITLSLFNEIGRQRVVDLAASVNANGGSVAFDGNYRPSGWEDASTARRAFAAIAPHCGIALPTFEDEVSLFGDADPSECLGRWHEMGAGLVVLKLGDQGAQVSVRGSAVQTVPCPERRNAKDTTGAGDSFNAGFLCSLLSGCDPVAAAQAGNKLAGSVIMHPGAIIPAEAMPA